MQGNILTLTVSQLNEYVKALFDSNEYFSHIYIKGEISNFVNHYKSGHLYFTLKDEGALLKCVMFKTYADKLKFSPEDGMKVIVRGKISVFVRDGVYQMYAESIEPDGLGALYMAYEQLKNKLEDKGLFDSEHKSAIPKFPKNIGIVTANGSAALADMLNIISRRYPVCNIFVYNSLVQGPLAPAQLRSGIEYLDAKDEIDLIIIGRGGGSLEDLWAFNDEALAYAVFNAKTPIISAVGHEVDFTICDFVSDLRAPTPSAAAELAVPDIREIFDLIETYRNSLTYGIKSKLESLSDAVLKYKSMPLFKDPYFTIDECKTRLMYAENSFFNSFENLLSEKKNAFSTSCAKIESLNPLSVLSRGYSVVKKDDKSVISVKEISKGESVEIVLSDGYASAKIENTFEK